MDAILVYVSDTYQLSSLREMLSKQSTLSRADFHRNFERTIQSACKDPIYAIGRKGGQVAIVFQLYKELKLTRGLSTAYHCDMLYQSSQLSPILVRSFNISLASQLDCYKLIAVGVDSDETWQPNQLLMQSKIESKL